MPTLREIFSNTADAIRTKTGKSDLISPPNFPQEISGIYPGTLMTSIRKGTTNRININLSVYEEE